MQRRVLVILVLALCIAAIPRAAFAHFPEVQGSEDCNGHLSYTVTAWNGWFDRRACLPWVFA